MAGGWKNFPAGKIEHKYMPESHVKILGRSDYHTLQNLSSNTIENNEPEISRITKSFRQIIYLEIFLRCQKLPNTQRNVICSIFCN
jgi:hypothetical protein